MSETYKLDVSRETFDDLERYVTLLKKWTKRINLISAATIPVIWDRHVRDSVQVYRSISNSDGIWLDVGSGGGLPGIVLAIIRKHEAPGVKTVLIESDLRKATFLRAVSRELDLRAEVISKRIEAADPVGASVISARALGPLEALLGFAERHLAPGGHAVFPKGETWQKEVDNARKTWRFDLDVVQSETDKKAAILIIGGIARV